MAHNFSESLFSFIRDDQLTKNQLNNSTQHFTCQELCLKKKNAHCTLYSTLLYNFFILLDCPKIEEPISIFLNFLN